MKNIIKKTLSLLLALLSLLSPVPMALIEADASSFGELSCDSFIKSAVSRAYINKMIPGYLDRYPFLQSELDAGKSVTFFFEGSDLGKPYASEKYNVRNQCAVIVVKKQGGKYSIAYHNEQSSSIPSHPQYHGRNGGYRHATISDGIYRSYTTNHLGSYAALNIRTLDNKASFNTYYDSVSRYESSGGINLHSRTDLYPYSEQRPTSAGCLLVGTSKSGYNEYMKTVVKGMNFNAWSNRFSSTNKEVGIVIVDRRLAAKSLVAADMYSQKGMDIITEFSYETEKEVDKMLGARLVRSYPCYGQIKITAKSAPVMTKACSTSTDKNSKVIETAKKGKTYTVLALYETIQENLYYEVNIGGKTGYIYAGNTSFVKPLSDIKLDGHTYPGSLKKGNGWTVKGTVSAKNTVFDSVTVGVYDPANGKMLTGATFTNADIGSGKYKDSYDIKKLDSKVLFGNLKDGFYHYTVSAKYSYRYAESAKKVSAEKSASVILSERGFGVGNSAAAEKKLTDSYMAKLKFYPSYCQVRVTAKNGAPIWNAAASDSTLKCAKVLSTVKKDEKLTVIGVYKNTANNYWYKLMLNGRVCYVFSGNVEFVKQLTDDISVSGLSDPSKFGAVRGVDLKGKITAKYQNITSVSANITNGISPVLGRGAVSVGARQSYDIASVCSDLNFTKLNVFSNYRFEIEVKAASYYVKNGSLKTASKYVTLHDARFRISLK